MVLDIGHFNICVPRTNISSNWPALPFKFFAYSYCVTSHFKGFFMSRFSILQVYNYFYLP